MSKKFYNLSDKQRIYLALFIFALLIVAFYGNTLMNGFVFDDRSVIEKNPYAQSWEYLPKVVTGCAWEASLVNGCKSTGIHYRPVQALSFLIAWHISPNPWPFHLLNLVYFLIAASLLFLFVKILTKNFFLAFLTGLLFALHPLNNEVANFVSLVPDLGLAIFTLGAGIYYFRYRTKNNSRDLILVYLFYFLAMLSKEPAFIVVPLSLLALDLIVFRLPVRSFVRWSPTLKIYLLLSIPAAIYFGMRLLVLGYRGTFLISASSAGGASPLERVYVFFTLFVGYMREIAYPYPLQFFHNFTVSDALLSPSFIFSFVGVAFFFAVVYLAIKRGERILAFFLSWIVIFFFPLLVFFDMAEMRVYFDRFLFVSSMGFAFIVSYALNYVWQHRTGSRLSHAIKGIDMRTRRIFVLIILGIIIFVSWSVVFPRNKDWKNFETMYTITLQQTPDAHIIRRELADSYFQQGNLDLARQEYEYLIQNAQGWKDITMAYKGLGDYYRAKGEGETALTYYLQSAQTAFNSPRDFAMYDVLGTLYMEQQDYLNGFASFCFSLSLFPTERTQQNFNQALSFIESEYIETNILHEQVKTSFTPASLQRIQYFDSRCQDDSCQFAFSYQADTLEVLPPFLITATTPHAWKKDTEVPVEITNKSYDPEQGIIILETDAQYENAELTFLFPTCRREYYSAETSDE